MVKILLSDFVATTPLYTWRVVDLPEFEGNLDPGQVILHCDTCGEERPFRDDRPRGSVHISGTLGTVERPPNPLGAGPYLIYLSCGFCLKQKNYFWVETDPEKSRIRKVGQWTPWSVDVAPDIAKSLGDNLDPFKKGMVCLGQGYGLAACAYFRRVLENQVDSILELLEQYLATDPSTEMAAAEVAALRNGKAADVKLQKASAFVPSTLAVAGHNPIRLLYELLSKGVHSLSEDECSELAQEISGTMTYVLTELARVTTARDRFIESIRSLGARNQRKTGI
jgi:hypothetical protein